MTDEKTSVEYITDFRGNNISVGDTVVYAAGSGRSITMIEATVLELYYVDLDREKNPNVRAKVAPLGSSRWEQHSQQTKYIDSRTGKGVDRYKHIKVDAHYRNKTTGECISLDNFRQLEDQTWTAGRASAGRYSVEGAKAVMQLRQEWGYVLTEFADYIVAEIQPIRPVTLLITKNMVNVSADTGSQPQMPAQDVE